MKQRSPKLLIFLTIFIDLLGFGIIIPILSWVGETYAGGEWKWFKVGALMSVYSLLQMIFAPFWGRLSDRVGRRPILLLSLAGSTASYLIFGFARSYWMLLVGRSIAGICAANLTAAQAYIADVTKPEERTAGMGLVGMAFGLGFTFGPIFGVAAAWLGGKFFPELPHQTLPGIAAATICGLNFLWAIRSLPESLPAERRAQAGEGSAHGGAGALAVFASLRDKTIGPLVMVFMLATLAFSQLETQMGPYIKLTPGLARKADAGAEAKPPAKPADEAVTAGVVEPAAAVADAQAAKSEENSTKTDREDEKLVYSLFIYVGLLLAFMHGYVVRKLVKFVPEAALVVVGTAAQALALAIFPLVPQVWCLLLSLGLVAFGQGICVPSLLALVSQSAGAHEQGRVMGITQSASTLGRILGPMTASAMIYVGAAIEGSGAGAAMEHAGLRWPFWSGAVCMVFAVWMAIVVRRGIIQRGAGSAAKA